MTTPDALLLLCIFGGLVFSSALMVAILAQHERIIQRLDRLISIVSKEDEIRKSVGLRETPVGRATKIKREDSLHNPLY